MAVRILITNDDGAAATQLVPLVRWCRKLGDVTVVVPKVEQSGKSHGIELHKPFEAKQISLAPDVTVWAVDSTPADCVRFAVLGLELEVDLVISGVNRGLNIGTDIQYSGTVGAASEAASLGIPALAISTLPDCYDRATEHLDRVFAYIRERDLFAYNNLYNVNIPPEPRDIRITHQGGPYFSDTFPLIGKDLYTPAGKQVWADRNDDTLDTDTTLHGYITITPLTTDRTQWQVYRKLVEQTQQCALL